MHRSDDGGLSWTEITEGLPTEFGFAAAAHPHDRDTLLRDPARSRPRALHARGPRGRLAHARRRRDLAAARRRAAAADAYVGVLREGMAIDRTTCPACTSARARARCLRAPTRARAGARSRATCRASRRSRSRSSTSDGRAASCRRRCRRSSRGLPRRRRDRGRHGRRGDRRGSTSAGRACATGSASPGPRCGRTSTSTSTASARRSTPRSSARLAGRCASPRSAAAELQRVDLDPALLGRDRAIASQSRISSCPSAKVGKSGSAGIAAVLDGPVDRAVELLEGVREALGVAGRDSRRGAARSAAPGRGRGCSFGRSRWPSQSSSCRSELQASAPSEPSTSNESVVLPAGADLRDRHLAAGAVLVAEEDVRDVLGRHRRRSTRSIAPASAYVSTGPVGDVPDRMDGVEIGEHRGDAAAGDPAGQVEPVRADVGDGPERAAELGIEAPVPVGRPGAASPGGTCRARSRRGRARRGGHARAPRAGAGRSGCCSSCSARARSPRRGGAAPPTPSRSSPAASRRRRACRRRGRPSPAGSGGGWASSGGRRARVRRPASPRSCRTAPASRPSGAPARATSRRRRSPSTPIRRRASTWTTPMKPVPTTAAPIPLIPPRI